MSVSLVQLLVVLVVILILFGAGKLPKVMGDLGRGLRNFRDSMKGDSDNVDNNSKDHKKNN